jgi:hypothetical protein
MATMKTRSERAEPEELSTAELTAEQAILLPERQFMRRYCRWTPNGLRCVWIPDSNTGGVVGQESVLAGVQA